MSLFKPKMYKKNVYDIDYHKLEEYGINFLIFDLDNTIALIDEEEANQKLQVFLNKLSRDFTILVASNNSKRRVNRFCKNINCDTYWFALKPFKLIKRFIKRKYKIEMSSIAFIGDQLVTDIFVGNRCDMFTVLVDPLQEKDLKITSLNRYIEKKIMKRINFKKGVYYEED